MPLSDLRLKKIYRTKQDNITEVLIVPALKESVVYDRGTGYFTLDSLAGLADGLIPFIQHGGVMRVVTSVQLSDTDVEAIKKGLAINEAVVTDKIHEQIEEDMKDEDSLLKLDFITNLIAAGILEIRIADVEQLLVEYDVPADLTVPAAKNILARPRCICGRPWTEDMIEEVKSLIRKLPPDNINSAMGEKVHQLRVSSADKRKAVKNDFDSLNGSNEKIKQLKDRIASLSIQITKSGSEAAEEIETRYQKIQDELIRVSAKVQNIDSRLPAMEKDLEGKKKLKATLSQGEEDAVKIEKESAFVEKCLIALERIKAVNRVTALKQINMRLQQAYKMLSDDYDLGRRIYIVQYDQVKMFQLITYFENQYKDTFQNMKKRGTVASLKAMGQSDEEIQETAMESIDEGIQ